MVGRASYGDLLQAGVRIYEIHGAVLHSKLATVDGAWSAIGSSNLDLRSVVYNNEVDAVVVGRETADAVSGVFDDDVTHAKEITLAAWRHRSFTETQERVHGALHGLAAIATYMRPGSTSDSASPHKVIHELFAGRRRVGGHGVLR